MNCARTPYEQVPMNLYLESSAAAKLLTIEAETPALERYLDDLAPDKTTLWASVLLETELRRLAVRERVDQTLVTGLLNGVNLLEPSRRLFRDAGLLPGPALRSLDALHVMTALTADVDVVLSYDRRLVEAARSVGLECVSPAA